ncbi:hypothetical protein ANCDUO_11805 [Ancylostoma duodenale]|uniref:Uncharacterized protein n=1 Tax=Ancylostoma duodenale TaxID=51022 RepID=A0A0C2CMY1_9BILA|nr:hypothetical protein ANCDUO_11805 [Ancylostoma duodenale]
MKLKDERTKMLNEVLNGIKFYSGTQTVIAQVDFTKNIDIIRKRIMLSLNRLMRRIAAELRISEVWVRRMVHEKLDRYYRLRKCQALSTCTQLTKVCRFYEILNHAANDTHRHFVLGHEKLFSVEATPIRQDKSTPPELSQAPKCRFSKETAIG